MAAEIRWETDMAKALERAAKEEKPILLDFFNPGWIGCQQMDAVTYPQPEVAAFVMDRVIPLRIPSDAEPYAPQFQVKWTPCLLTLDAEGVEHFRSVGFLSAVELIPSLILRSGRLHFDAGDHQPGIKDFDEVIHKYPQSHAAPEATFYRGVAQYKHSDDPASLKAAHQKLSAEYPDSEWALRAHPYSLL